jgi:hypothetical protein
MEGPADFAAGRTLWQRCRQTETPEDEAERFLDLAGLADGTLDEEERERVAAWVKNDPFALAEVAAARALCAGGIPMSGGIEPIVERAISILDKASERARVVPFSSPPPVRAALQVAAQWGSVAVAIAFAGWLGFAMGSGASQSLIQPSQANQIGDETFLPELLDPSTGFLRDLAVGQQT